MSPHEIKIGRPTMRFLLKIAFLLGLVAFFLPSARQDGASAEAGLSPVVLVYGVQQALADIGGFCGRAPAACASGQEALRFAGERIGDGLALAYALASDHVAPAAGPTDPAPATLPARGETHTPPPPSAYTPPASAAAPHAGGGASDPLTTAAIERSPAAGSARPAPPAHAPEAVPVRPPLPRSAPRA